MNNKIYRLLRNNKEQGPFTADELIQKSLKPFDLIWVDGRSAAWNYPTEIKEFKAYMPDAEQSNVSVMVKQENRISSAVQAAVAVNENLKLADIKKDKPRYKVSAAWSKIQTITTPAFQNVMVAEPKKSSNNKLVEATGTQVQSKSLSWQDAWKDWEKEKNTIPTQPQTIAVPQKKVKETSYTAPVLEKKFEQSLDTITDNYIDNILAQKKKNKGFSFGKSSEFIVPSLALIVIFSIGYWLMHNDKIASALSIPTSTQQPPTNNQSTISNTNTTTVSNNSQPETSTQNVVSNQPVVKNNLATPEARDKKIVKNTSNIKAITPVTSNSTGSETLNTNTVNTLNTNVAKTTTTTSKQFDPSVINNVPNSSVYNDPSGANNGDLNAAESRPVKRRTNGGDATTNSTDNNSANAASNNSTADINSKSVINYVSVPQYVQMDGNGTGNLKIQNNSDLDLDLVVVDVQYYDASGRYRKGETLYLHNLRAGKSVNVKTSKDANSAYATSKVSVVSSEANGVYAVGDN